MDLTSRCSPNTREEDGTMTYLEKVQELEQGAMCQTPMPRYQCHKKVWALKIAAIELMRPTIEELQDVFDGKDEHNLVAAIITPAEPGYGPFGVPKAYVDKHSPEVGGYFVVYEDGYKSFSPAQAFEEGYTRI